MIDITHDHKKLVATAGMKSLYFSHRIASESKSTDEFPPIQQKHQHSYLHFYP